MDTPLPDTESSAGPFEIPDAAAAWTALDAIDDAQRAVLARQVDPVRQFALTLWMYPAGVLIGFTVAQPDPGRGLVVAAVVAVGAILLAAGWQVWRWYRSEVRVTAPRRRRDGQRTAASPDPFTLYAAVYFSFRWPHWWTLVIVSPLAVGSQLWVLSAQQRVRRPPRLMRRLRRRRTRELTFYREFLDPDVLRTAGALAVISSAKSRALAAEVDLDHDRLEQAITTLDRLGYLHPASPDEKVRRFSLNDPGRDAYRHHLHALERTAEAPPARAETVAA